MSGRGKGIGNESEGPKGSAGSGGPTINGSIEAMLTPELLFRMNKKIAQLTKVVYGLNTRGEELESQLTHLRESEEALKTSNNELQIKANHYKTKYDTEIGKLRDMESQASQVQFWKVECENLKRRLDLEGGMGMMGGDARAAIAAAREDADRALRREKAVTYELEQARQAITNLKGHHDFIMRERDAQMAMEREKQELEWQTRMADLENRYKAQVRRANDEMEVITAECDILRRRVQETSGAETGLRDQIMTLQRDLDRQRREWELKVQMKEQDAQEAALRFSQEKRDYDVKIRNLEEEKRLQEEEWEERLREEERRGECRNRDIKDKCETLQRLLDENEEEYESKLKSKVVEWKTEWDSVEEGLRDEIRRLKDENELMKVDSTLMKGRLDRSTIEYEMRIQELEEEMRGKTRDYDVQVRSLKERLSSIENVNRQQNLDRSDTEKKFREERDKYRQMEIMYEVAQKVKEELEEKTRQLSERERELTAEVMTLTTENQELKTEKEELEEELDGKEEEWTAKIEEEGRAIEFKTKMRVERTWLEKLRRSEETAAQDMERMRESYKRSENDIRKELAMAQKSEEEAKRLNEEFKKRVRVLRQSEADANHRIKDLEDLIGEMRKQGDSTAISRKELAAQEERYQKQVDQLTLALAEKQEEVRALTQRLEELNGIKEKLKESEQLQVRLDALQKELREKCAAMDSVRVELQYSKNEVELTKSKLKKLEEDLDNARQKNISLQNQLTANSNCEKGEDLATKISTLEDRLKICQAEKEKLTKTIEEIEAERDDEIKIIQDALDEAAQEREELIATFEKELQNINTMNSNREQQLMEDFEWKLREIEKEHKKKLEEKDRMAEERLNAVRNLVESELAESITKVAEDRRLADEKLAEVGHLKSYEAEAIQLRGVTHELQKALRASAREMERLKMREKILEEEVRGLKKAQPSRQNTLHRHKRHADDTEAEFRQKQEKMKSELNAEWEDKLRTECSRLKAELDDLHAEEKHLAVESMKVQKEQEIRALKQSWELRQEEMAKEISTLKDSLTDKDAYYHKEMENLRTNADRDVWELRRKLQKLDEKNWTQQERLQEKHTEEMERLKQDFKEQVADLEARLAVTSQISGEDDRRQLEKSHNDEVEHLCEQHRSSMERLREELEAEKFQAVEEARVIVSEHLEHVNTSLREQLLEATCANTQYREELEAIRAALKLREEVISSLEEELMKVKGGSETAASFYKASQYSFAGSDESNSSQDRLSMSDSLDNQDDAQKSGITYLYVAFFFLFFRYLPSDVALALTTIGLFTHTFHLYKEKKM
ncbi:trichohyalin-like isoform X7 [Macrobrachium rosenbergii]|uniref:trichohyalin-like isoform X7 n=1 Tax=Macrobrachium rosenbergii TaxID=79674 RepID=UPI0034D4EA34